jgi:protein TonB
VIAALASAGLHLGILFGFEHQKKQTVAALPGPDVITLTLEMPDLKELDEPEPLANDDPGEPLEPGVLVPMLADAPQVPQPNDFVQQMDFASLIEQPDMSQAKLVAIPEHIARGGKIGEGLGAIFNLADLDRAPEPIVQPAPIAPKVTDRDNADLIVVIEFIVSADGRVLNAMATNNADRRFEQAAVSGVSKWKFRPGIKAGRKVNTRMAVPIIFKAAE